MFVDLDWPLNASSLLSASAELLVFLCFGAIIRDDKYVSDSWSIGIVNLNYISEYDDWISVITACSAHEASHTSSLAADSIKGGRSTGEHGNQNWCTSFYIFSLSFCQMVMNLYFGPSSHRDYRFVQVKGLLTEVIDRRNVGLNKRLYLIGFSLITCAEEVMFSSALISYLAGLRKNCSIDFNNSMEI